MSPTGLIALQGVGAEKRSPLTTVFNGVSSAPLGDTAGTEGVPGAGSEPPFPISTTKILKMELLWNLSTQT